MLVVVVGIEKRAEQPAIVQAIHVIGLEGPTQSLQIAVAADVIVATKVKVGRIVGLAPTMAAVFDVRDLARRRRCSTRLVT